MFRTLWVHPQGDSYICTHTLLSNRLLTTMHVKHTILNITAASMRIKPRDSKHVGDIRNYILIYKNYVFRWFVLYNSCPYWFIVLMIYSE